jgi:hypothetical protein
VLVEEVVGGSNIILQSTLDEEPLFQVPKTSSVQEPHFLKTLELEIAKEKEYRQRLEEENRQVRQRLAMHVTLIPPLIDGSLAHEKDQTASAGEQFGCPGSSSC